MKSPNYLTGPTGVGRVFSYRLYGLNVRSEISLGLPEGDWGTSGADFFIRRGRYLRADLAERLVAWSPCPTHGVDIRVWRAPDGAARVWNRAIATFYIPGDGRTVDVFPEPGADQMAVRAVLLGPVAVFVLHRRGWPALHASAVLVDGRAVAFIGPRGGGKSTLAAAFVARGFKLLTDDVLPLRPDGEIIRALSGPPQLKLWPDAVRFTLGPGQSPAEAPPFPGKNLLSPGEPAGPEPVPLAAAYVLERRPPDTGLVSPVIQAVRGHVGVATLLAHTLNRSYLFPAEEAMFLSAYAPLVGQGRLKRLTLPDGPDYLEETCRRVLEDLS